MQEASFFQLSDVKTELCRLKSLKVKFKTEKSKNTQKDYHPRDYSRSYRTVLAHSLKLACHFSCLTASFGQYRRLAVEGWCHSFLAAEDIWRLWADAAAPWQDWLWQRRTPAWPLVSSVSSWIEQKCSESYWKHWSSKWLRVKCVQNYVSQWEGIPRGRGGGTHPNWDRMQDPPDTTSPFSPVPLTCSCNLPPSVPIRCPGTPHFFHTHTICWPQNED